MLTGSCPLNAPPRFILHNTVFLYEDSPRKQVHFKEGPFCKPVENVLSAKNIYLSKFALLEIKKRGPVNR